MYTVDIDTGGTYTDGLFGDGKELTWVKVDTTPHDLTVGFIQCFEEGAKKLGLFVTKGSEDTWSLSGSLATLSVRWLSIQKVESI